MTKRILALDIRHAGISALLVRNTFNGNHIESFRYVPFEEDPGVDAAGSLLENAIEAIVSDFDVSDIECAISLPPDKISYRNLSVPFTDRRKISQILPFEIESVMPYPIDELTIDFEKTGRTDPTDICVAAVRKTDMEPVVEILARYGISPQCIAPAALPAAVALAALSGDMADFMWIDADVFDVTVIAVSSGSVHLVRTISAGSGDEAGKTRRFQPHLVQFLAAFESSFHKDFEPAAVFYSGTGLDVESLETVIDRTVGVEVKKADLASLPNLNAVLLKTEGYRPELFNGALGLAASEIKGFRLINFRGERSTLKRYWEEYKNEILTSGFIAAFVIILVMFQVLLEAYYLQRSIDRLNRQIVAVFQTTFPDITRIVDPVQQMRLALQEVKEKSTFAVSMEAGVSNIELFKEMSVAVPAGLDVEITRLVRGDEDVIITGNTDTFQTVDEIKGNLEKSKVWKAITIASANLDKNSNRVEFRLKIDL